MYILPKLTQACIAYAHTHAQSASAHVCIQCIRSHVHILTCVYCAYPHMCTFSAYAHTRAYNAYAHTRAFKHMLDFRKHRLSFCHLLFVPYCRYGDMQRHFPIIHIHTACLSPEWCPRGRVQHDWGAAFPGDRALVCGAQHSDVISGRHRLWPIGDSLAISGLALLLSKGPKPCLISYQRPVMGCLEMHQMLLI